MIGIYPFPDSVNGTIPADTPSSTYVLPYHVLVSMDMHYLHDCISFDFLHNLM